MLRTVNKYLSFHINSQIVWRGGENDDVQGELTTDACSVLMKGLWAAKLALPDLSKAITALASKVSKWTRNHGRMLYRLYVDVQGI